MTIHSTHFKAHSNLIGRAYPFEYLQKVGQASEASILIMYGRRRVGKTTLLEQAFRQRNVLKFEGIEGQPEARQQKHVLEQLAEYAQDPVLAKVQPEHWLDVFKILAGYVQKGTWTLYFEEIQWLANYGGNFIAEFKVIWDNALRHNRKLLVIFCGSSPSFVIHEILRSKALYNRSQHEMFLPEFNLLETREFLKKRSLSEVLDAYLTVGGIPEYLKWVNKNSSVFLSLCERSFKPGGFFTHEYERIFTSNLAHNKHYQKIIEYLSKQRFATREEIRKALKIESGGTLSLILGDLEICGFVQKYTPYNLASDSLLARYCISDAYLQFYFKFIKPLQPDVDQGRFEKHPSQAIKTENYSKWLGFAFERLCRKQHHLIAKILGFHGVHYRSGAFFNRAAQNQTTGYQCDLVFERDDKVLTLCEVKYAKSKIGTGVIAELEAKRAHIPQGKRMSVQKVLITTEGADPALLRKAYFDHVIVLEDLFAEKYY